MDRVKLLILIILDGWGVAGNSPVNAIAAAKTPNFDYFKKKYPNTTLSASGKAVGLPAGQMGNSEVGHLNIGAGRIVPQDFTRINKAIKNGSFYDNPALVQAIKNAKKVKSKIHLMGLLSDGGVHSHLNHFEAMIALCSKFGLNPILHLFLDGRDVPPKSALKYVKQLKERISNIGCAQVATISGRYYAMDRDNRWQRVQKAYEAMVYGKGYKASNSEEAIKMAYGRAETDEFVKPTLVRRAKSDDELEIKENDSVVFINFRPDRAREITKTFIDSDFNEFDRGHHPPHVFFVSMTQYDETYDIPVAFSPSRPKHILADILAENNLTQLRIAETEKYAHVTFFFNGGEEIKRPLEERLLIPSPKVATYDLKPEMSSNEVTDEVVKQIKSLKFNVIILNFANPDMVGHTGCFKAAKAAIEAIDANLGRIHDAIKEKKGIAIITADHGNAEKMAEVSIGKPYTAHTTNKVPFFIINPLAKEQMKLKSGGILADIAPTVLGILGIKKPKEMTGQSLIAQK